MIITERVYTWWNTAFICVAMFKKFLKLARSPVLVVNTAFKKLGELQVGDFAPMRPAIDTDEARARAKRLITRNGGLFSRLA